MNKIRVLNLVKKYSKKLKIKTPRLIIIHYGEFGWCTNKNELFLSANLINKKNWTVIEGIILHELCHLYFKDPKNKFIVFSFSYFLYLSVILLLIFKFHLGIVLSVALALSSTLFAKIIYNLYSKKIEFRADALAATISRKSVLAALIAIKKKEIFFRKRNKLPFLYHLSHPNTDERITRIKMLSRQTHKV